MIELPLTFFTRITGEMGIHQFLFLERAEGYGNAIMKSYSFDPRDTMWIFSHTGINNVNIDIALRAKELGMQVIATGSAAESSVSRHPSGRTLFEIADVVIDTRVPAGDSAGLSGGRCHDRRTRLARRLQRPRAALARAHRPGQLFRRRAGAALRPLPGRGGEPALRHRPARATLRRQLRDGLPSAVHAATSRRPRSAYCDWTVPVA